MYRCQITNIVSRPGDKVNKIVVETRPKTYKHWDNEAEESWESVGFEVVRELNMSNRGLELWTAMSVEEKKIFLETHR